MSEQTMVERVAQTLCDRIPGSCYSMIDGKPCICTGIARDAIEAMREPTDRMIADGREACDGLSSIIARYVWHNMILAALAEEWHEASPPKG